MFLALKRHFTSDSYSYFKYNGKVKLNQESFLKRNDKYMFHKLSKKDDLEQFILSNILANEDVWVTGLLDSKADDIHKARRKRVESMTYNFKREMSSIKDRDFNTMLKCTDGQHPQLLRLYQNGTISMESLMIVNECTSVFKHWNKSIVDEIIWPSLYRKMKKYRDFLTLGDKTSEYSELIVNTFEKESNKS